jgi:effector-binding domain-containing protein
MLYQIRCKTLAPQPVLFIRTQVHPSDIQQAIRSALVEISEYLQSRGLRPGAPPYARYHAFNDEGVDLETGVPVLRRVAGSGQIQSGEIPQGEYVCTEHWGPYDEIADARRALSQWMFDRGRHASGPSIEIYWTDPTSEPDSTRWHTELMRPLEPVAKAASVA